MSQKKVLIAFAAVLVLAIGGTYAGIRLSQPSYRHAWCAQVETVLNTKVKARAYNRALRQAHSPLATRLRSDIGVFNYEDAAVQSSSDLQVMGAITTAMGALDQVMTDVRAIDRACGVPVSEAKKQRI